MLSEWVDNERSWARLEGDDQFHAVDFVMMGPRWQFVCGVVTWEKVEQTRNVPDIICEVCSDKLRLSSKYQ